MSCKFFDGYATCLSSALSYEAKNGTPMLSIIC
ncbi:hypothetical protein SNOG_01179 [Parastagonospora nodorum SN15]|uniref:Uncharacterized protein n=1 Tax=Phaeosphaeria nodorum (strain SN15 / ATCC MYA-4574 / FGSC 10173) TaxID=321614 RepID=Q0V485_PHANO|nr:hypothetical protein SNOG_01179 [Parastagonospora nodorum SN15]EAT90828.1 hypothetical protein SNOG_01179 [Parastagonospora nodorum SN15]